MYLDEYGTEWDRLDVESAIERAYALGVAETLGEAHPGEFDRLTEAVGSAHERALVELAYDKGRNRGREAPTDTDTETVYAGLVNDDERERVTVTRTQDLPKALRSLRLLEPPADGLDRIRLPRFLLRR